VTQSKLPHWRRRHPPKPTFPTDIRLGSLSQFWKTSHSRTVAGWHGRKRVKETTSPQHHITAIATNSNSHSHPRAHNLGSNCTHRSELLPPPASSRPLRSSAFFPPPPPPLLSTSSPPDPTPTHPHMRFPLSPHQNQSHKHTPTTPPHTMTPPQQSQIPTPPHTPHTLPVFAYPRSLPAFCQSFGGGFGDGSVPEDEAGDDSGLLKPGAVLGVVHHRHRHPPSATRKSSSRGRGGRDGGGVLGSWRSATAAL
jgi:hypothetical protein